MNLRYEISVAHKGPVYTSPGWLPGRSSSIRYPKIFQRLPEPGVTQPRSWTHGPGEGGDDYDILRCRARSNNASISDAGKRPILLTRDHLYSKLVIRESHELVFHNGLRATLNHVRTRYWISRGREAVKKVIRPCIVYHLQVAFYLIYLVFA